MDPQDFSQATLLGKPQSSGRPYIKEKLAGWGGDMAQQLKATATKPDTLGSVPWYPHGGGSE